MKIMTEAEAKIVCPMCSSIKTTTSVRQYPDMPNVVDVGWKCLKCGHEWGFEV